MRPMTVKDEARKRSQIFLKKNSSDLVYLAINFRAREFHEKERSCGVGCYVVGGWYTTKFNVDLKCARLVT